MSNFISKEKYEKIIASSPTTMKLRIYIGESSDDPFYMVWYNETFKVKNNV